MWNAHPISCQIQTNKLALTHYRDIIVYKEGLAAGKGLWESRVPPCFAPPVMALLFIGYSIV
jgi:hypothetical protein